MIFSKVFWTLLTALCLLPTAYSAERPAPVRPASEDRETEWSQYLAGEMQGEAEAQCPDGSRVDVLTSDTAWEVEWPPKWQQAIGQAVYYRAATGRRGGVLLLMGRQPKKVEIIYYLRCLVACRECGLALKVEQVGEARGQQAEGSGQEEARTRSTPLPAGLKAHWQEWNGKQYPACYDCECAKCGAPRYFGAYDGLCNECSEASDE